MEMRCAALRHRHGSKMPEEGQHTGVVGALAAGPLLAEAIGRLRQGRSLAEPMVL
ncbi:hypothetical protein [Sphingomonas oleivorans]|uniref:hypothetical protein n=1 Tax=Sphingomonas oleivorans TaxID=1735121 RepID=UPI0013FDEA25|nr:hypothetical protein [Sphingomonas oleivorans]